MKKKILCIDDDPLMREVLVDHFGNTGYAVRTATSGVDGIEAFRNEVPDIVLCDLRMPGMDGFEVIAEIQKLDRGIPIIVVSGTALIHDAVAALKSGAWDFVTKPIRDLEVLSHTVNTSLERAKLIRENERYRKHLEEEVELRTHALRNEVAERRKTEERLKISLEEKEALLKEVHHRVKNNLQVISSLLRLQQQYVSEPASLRAFVESQNRVRAMALVHDLLYRSADIAHISAGDYVKGLAESLVGSDAGAADVECTLDIDELDFTVEVAIPCGLVLNELISNAVQHAFPVPDGRSSQNGGLGEGKKIQVVLKADPTDARRPAARLLVTDNGAGLPPGFDLKAIQTLGLQLVVSLVSQLDGTIETVPAEKGTGFEIRFPLA